jgi:hypothetical protein
MPYIPPNPTPALVQTATRRFDADPRTALPDQALTALFAQFPFNENVSHVLPKVATLNALYSTNIYDVTTVARHIVGARIDGPLTSGEPTAVDAIARIRFGERERSTYSFATKYCAWSKPDNYAIYDRFVADMLIAYQVKDSFSSFSPADLRRYASFAQVLQTFIRHYQLESFSLKTVDKFLWWQGREAAGV